MTNLKPISVIYAEIDTGIICDMHGVRNVRPAPIPRSYFDDLAAAEAHSQDVTQRHPELGCEIELPDGQKKGPLVATQIVIRRRSQYANRLRQFAVWVNGQLGGSLADGDTKRFVVPPGEYVVFLMVDAFKSDAISLTLRAGDVATLFCGSDATGWKAALAELCGLWRKWVFLRPKW